MASNIFSRLVPSGRGRSFYEDLRARAGSPDVEERAGLTLDDENLNHHFHDDDLDGAEDLGAEGSAGPSSSSGSPLRSRKDHTARWPGMDDDADDDVPESLLVESHDVEPASQPTHRRQPQLQARSRAVPGSTTRKSRAQWETTQNHQRLHEDDGSSPGPAARGQPGSLMANAVPGSAREKAMWRWVNVSNLDNFIRDVYDYYQGCGIWCILTERFLHLL